MLLPILSLAQTRGGAGSNNGYYIKTINAGTITADSLVDTVRVSKPLVTTSVNYGTAAQPAIAVDSGGYGMYRTSTTLGFATAGARRMFLNSSGLNMASSSGYAQIGNTGFSSTVALFRTYGATGYGMGFESANNVNLITSSITRLKVS